MRCRLCVFECSDGDATAIFSDEGESCLSKLIVKYLYLEITKYDEFSTKICFACKKHLQEFNDFFLKVEHGQSQLKTVFLEQQEHLNSDLIERKPTNLESIEECLIDFKDVEVENESAVAEEEEFGFAESEPQLESNTQIKRKSSRKEKNIATVQDIPTVERKKRGRPRKKSKSEEGIVEPANAIDTSTNEKSLNEAKAKQSPEKKKEIDNFIARNIELKCQICGEVLPTFSKLRSHFREKHNQKAFVICCGLRLAQRWRLVNHIRLHVDPNHFKCKYCEKTLTTQLGYERHLANYHSDREKKNHVCEVCQKRFGLKYSLKIHMNVHKREANHQCENCKKRFKTLNALQNHTQFVHAERPLFMCDICGKELKSKQILQSHIKELHTGSSRVKCSFCNKWVSNSYLKRHEDFHILKEAECDECGKIFTSEGALRAHKRGLAHKKRNFSCTLCGKAFKEKRFLAEHVAIHTGRKDYACKYCQREFRSQSNMRKHIRQIHVDEYAQEQQNKKASKRLENESPVSTSHCF